MRKTFDTYQPYGFGSECYSRVLRPGRAAQDAALVTEPNNGVPGELTTFFDPEVIKSSLYAHGDKRFGVGHRVFL